MMRLLILGLISVVYGEAPYIPRGWTPEGQAFNLPSKQQYASPNTQYLPSQESARDFNRIETEYGLPNTYSNNQPINQAGHWQQNANINQFLPSNINSAAKNNQFTPDNQARWANLNEKNRAQWNIINQNPAQSTNTFNNNAEQSEQQTQSNNFAGQQQWRSSNKMHVPQPNYDQSAVNITPQPNVNRQNTQLPHAANKYDGNFETQSNNQFGQFVPRDKIMPTPKVSNNNRVPLPQNHSPPQQYDGDAPEDVFALKTDTTTMKPDKHLPETNTDENDENQSAQLNVVIKPGVEAEAEAEAGVGVDTSMISGSMTGQYYLLLPDGRLQRVIYLTSPNDKENGYTANLMYENVEPLKGPIFSYNDAPLVRVN